MSDNLTQDYGYQDAAPCPYAIANLWKPLVKILETNFSAPKSLFEVGCGNGSAANMLHQLGWQVTGIDPSVTGIAIANRTYPEARLEQGSAYDDLAARYGHFPAVVSLEVIEHCYYPRLYAKTLFNLVEDGGVAIISTPYHGYIKNIAIAVSGKMDHHFAALWDGGHIKFWSISTLTTLLKEAGFREIEYHRVGRLPFIAKSMIAVARK
jgi:2-polyprenyl-3-methyl-5-hydroxy-6-metoxy-1,4-benzoquinol methylase